MLVDGSVAFLLENKTFWIFDFLPIMEDLLFMGQLLDIIFAQAGQIGPCAMPEIARHIQYVSEEYINPDNHMEVEATVKHNDISTCGDENNVSR